MLTNRPIYRKESYGYETTTPEKSAQKFMGLPFCCTVEHLQLKNVTDDVMNIIVTITLGVKCASDSRMHQNATF